MCLLSKDSRIPLPAQEWAGNATSPGAKVGRNGSQVRAGCDDLRAKPGGTEGSWEGPEWGSSRARHGF